MFSVVLLWSCGKRIKGPASRMVNSTSAGIYVTDMRLRDTGAHADSTILLANGSGIIDLSKRDCFIEVEKLGRNKIQLNAFFRESSILSCELKLKQSSWLSFGAGRFWSVTNKETTENISLRWEGRNTCSDSHIRFSYVNELGQVLSMWGQGVLN